MQVNRRTQKDRSAATRAALIAAARSLFAAHGFASVGTEAIVEAAGVTRGALYHHFADKTELFAAVFEAVGEDVNLRTAAAVTSAGTTDPVAAMELGAAAYLEACGEPEVQRILIVDAPAVLGWVRWREVGNQYGLGLVEGLLSAAMELGRVAAQPVRPLAHVLIAAMDEAALYVALAEDTDRAKDEMRAVIHQLVSALEI